jgi:hypothetical protein
VCRVASLFAGSCLRSDEQEGEMIAWAKWLPLLLVLLALPMRAQAQSPTPASTQSDQLLKPEALDALVAPVALYPDTLLSQILMASTYPLEVVQAERWVEANKKLKGDELKSAVDKQGWDDSVKSLVAAPSVLEMMNSKLDWTQKLGDAVLAQQPDVMDAIQRLRTKAQANKKLESNQQQNVTVKQQDNKQVIVIEQRDPNTVYVPYYNPSVVYGGWPYPTYPPYYFPPPGYIAGGLLATGLAFGAGYALGRWASGGNYWNSSVNWNNNNININTGNRPGGGNNWQHRPEHRQGVRYGNADVRQKFGNNDLRAGSSNRMDFRGRGGEQVLKPGGGDRTGIGGGNVGGGNRPSSPGAGNRPSGPGAGNRPGAGAGARPGGGGRDSALGNISSGRVASRESTRGRGSLGGGGGGGLRAGGGGGGGGGGGLRAGGGGGRGGGGGGGRRSDIRLKHDIALLGRLDNGLGIYRFSYNGSNKVYVGVLAQEVMGVRPDAAVVGPDGYLRVYYEKLGVKFETYQEWLRSGGQSEHAPGSKASE